MMLIHEVDMLAMEIPMSGKDKNDNNKEQNPHACGNANNNVGLESFKTYWSPKAPHQVQKTEPKISQDHNTNNENFFGIGEREGADYDTKGGHEYGMGENSDLSYGLLGRRDVDYVLGDRRMPPYGNRQVPKERKYLY